MKKRRKKKLRFSQGFKYETYFIYPFIINSYKYIFSLSAGIIKPHAVRSKRRPGFSRSRTKARIVIFQLCLFTRHEFRFTFDGIFRAVEVTEREREPAGGNEKRREPIVPS